MADPLSWAVVATMASTAASMKNASLQRHAATKQAQRARAENDRVLEEQKTADAAIRIAEARVQDDEATLEFGGANDLDLLVGRGSGKREVQAAPSVTGLRVG